MKDKNRIDLYDMLRLIRRRFPQYRFAIIKEGGTFNIITNGKSKVEDKVIDFMCEYIQHRSLHKKDDIWWNTTILHDHFNEMDKVMEIERIGLEKGYTGYNNYRYWFSEKVCGYKFVSESDFYNE